VTDQNDNKGGERGADDEELVLDWDDAVDSWGQTMDRSAKAEAAPFPTRIEVPAELPDDLMSVFERPTIPPGGLVTDPAPAPAEGKQGSHSPPEAARPRLYRPPTSEELSALGSARPPRAADALKINVPRTSAHDSYQEDADATQIASIPRELIESLARADASEHDLDSGAIAGDDSYSIAIEDIDLEQPTGPRDTDPTQLGGGQEGSGVFAPQSVRPVPPPVPDQSGTNRVPLPTPVVPPPTHFDALEGEMIELPVQIRTPPPLPPLPMFPDRPRSTPPPVPRPQAEHSVLKNLDELAPPLPKRASQQPEVVVTPGEDRGAATAMRTVRTRKPRRENLRLVASDDSGRRARVELLLALAQAAESERKPALLVQAAELCEELADPARARTLYREALAVDPRHTISLTALARLALDERDYGAYVGHLEQLASASIAPHDRARVHRELCLVRWLIDGDLPSALREAAEAERFAPDDLAHKLLLSRLEVACLGEQADASLRALAGQISDDALRAAWLSTAGRVCEQRGDTAAALHDFRRAAALDPTALDAQLGAARSARSEGAAAVIEALRRAATLSGEGVAAVALRRSAAVLLGSEPDGREAALELLAGATDVASLRSAAELSRGSDRELGVVTSWSESTHGPERALALVTLAEARAGADDAAGSEAALAAASKAAPDLALVSVVREMLARKRGDASALAEMAASDEASHGPLAAAAKLATDVYAVARELSWLERSHAVSSDPWCTETLLIDAAAEASDQARVRSSLRAELDRAAPHARASALLTLADLAHRHRDGDELTTELASAVDADSRNTLLARAYARSHPPEGELARVMRREAEHSSGARAAFAHLRAAYALADDHEGRLSAFAAAYDAAPSYLPAVWALHQEARRQGDLERLHTLHAKEAGRARDPHEAVAHLVRAALVRAGSDTDAAALQLARGLDLMPTDPVLRELVIRLGDAVPATLRAEAMQRMAEHAPNQLERPALLSAAGAFEDASQPDRAAALYQEVLAREPHDPIATMGLERAALAAGKIAELLEQKRRALELATTPAAQLDALEDLMHLDVDADPELTIERARQLLELEPDHPGALRRIERHAMQHGDVITLFEVEARMAQSSLGAHDRATRLRALWVLAQLRGDEQAAHEVDEMVLTLGPSAKDGSWLGRQLLSSAAVMGDRAGIERALELLIDASSDPMELLTLTLQRAQLLVDRQPEKLEMAIRDAANQFANHPLTAEALADVQLALNDARRAAEHYEEAAKAALDERRRARLYHQVGKLYQEQLKSPDKARDALRKAAEADLTYGDVQARLESLLSGRNDLEGLIGLAEARLKSGGTPSQIAELNRQLGKLYEKRGDKAGARKKLEEAHAAEPDNLAVLRDIASAYEAEGNYRECAESLIRLARLSRDPVELRETFFKLGEIYDLHLPDPRRAEAAYRRVLKLGPRHVKALERLSALYRREGQRDLSAEALERLLQAVESPARRREVAFELAKLKEDHGDARGAEETLETLRRKSPEDLYVLRGLADFYRRNKAQSALAMHLNRAVDDLRRAVEQDFDDAALWTALVEMLDEKQRRDAARACASAAFALGLADAGVAQHTDNEGNIPGVGGAAFSELLDDLVFPDNVPGAARILFRHGGEALNKAAPFDVRVVGGEKVDKKHSLRGVVQEMARWVNSTDIEIFSSAQLPYAFVPVGEAPIQLLVGKALLDNLTRGEQQFLVARALKIARAQMSVTCRIRPEEMALMLLALVRSQAPGFEPPGVDLANLDEMARRVGRHLSKRAREDLAPHLMELAGSTDFDPSRVYWLASTAGNRAGLLATGSLPSALSALAKLSGLAREGRTTATVVAQIEEARELLGFAISESHFEARQRAGADRR
jgi:tetratricopeptide (TPR) repeat protein